ncbi:glutamate receptor 2.7-like [Coffea arabica]|uniref:Glutamate receptor n=1 Tax=Coffea arabica TaxID=13443 RepID=A0ABM4UQJ4_COFAR
MEMSDSAGEPKFLDLSYIKKDKEKENLLCIKIDSRNDTDETGLSSTHSSIRIGVVLDLDSPMGAMLDLCLSMAHSDFYSVHSNYQTRLSLHRKNAKGQFGVGSAGGTSSFSLNFELLPAVESFRTQLMDVMSQIGLFSSKTGDEVQKQQIVLELLKNEEVHGVLGRESLTESAFVAELGARAHVPVISFTAESQGFSHTKSSYFVRMSPDDLYQIKGLAAICQQFGWHNIVVIYEDSRHGNVFMSKLNKEFQEVDIRVGYSSAVSTSADDVYITKGLNKLMTMQTRVFLVHMNTLLGCRLFHLARKAGMMTEGYAWLITDSFSNFLNSEDSSSLEVWALAMAIEKLLPVSSDLLQLSHGENEREISNLGISKIGQKLLTELSHTKFTGLSGKFELVDGELKPLAFEIFNVIGTGDRTVGYWTPSRGISKILGSISAKELKVIMWPGDTLVPPRGWAIPSNGKLKVGVPKKEGFTEFVKVQVDPLTNQPQLLPFKLDYEFVPFMNASGHRNGSYADLLHRILDQSYDFVVGDITILADRAAYVDFTLPYTESGVVMVVKNKMSIDMWIFLKPLRWDLWLAIIVACIFIEVVPRLMERERNSTDAGSSMPRGQQVGLFVFPIAALAFPERNMVSNNWSRFVLVVWLFVAFILMQSYTAKLSSIFTVDQLEFSFSEEYYVGHQHGSFTRDFLINELHLNESKLRSYTRFEDYHDAMSRGSRKGGIDAIVGETPYMKLFLNRYGSEYRMAFPIGSPLVSYFSRAILDITQGPNMTTIEQKNLGPGYPSDSVDRDDPNLTAYNFGGLFIIICSAAIFSLFCSETSVGQRFTTTASHYGQRCCCSFPIFRGKESSVHSVSDTDASGESSSEEANEIQESKTNTSDRPEEVEVLESSSEDVSAGEVGSS